MKKLLFLSLLFPFWLFAQEEDIIVKDSTDVDFIIIEGDSIPKKSIYLDEILLLPSLHFNSKEERYRYYILRRKTLKVYPYAKLAAERLETLNARLKTLDRKGDKRSYARKVQKYIEEEFSEELKKLTRTEGQILVKLIHRQTGQTTFDLIKELRSGWRAFWFNTTASLFDISLKREFDPINVKEDFYIEDILIRAKQSGLLELRAPSVEFDYFELSDKWADKKTESTED
ncbi:DUF4294 domain-containing protein [Mesoflavibacter sp. CH_XMU1404-2]|uniref:DUF4294 domain-containing protein n=1 Tax=Mesoflavibacter sp. CH_XMU1404-2 TaxID=3107766 RepID=UPI0030088AB5